MREKATLKRPNAKNLCAYRKDTCGASQAMLKLPKTPTFLEEDSSFH